jgi:hypothetical protein
MLWAFSWLNIHLPPDWTPVLSFLLFWSLLTIGQAIQFRRTIKTQPIVDKYHGKLYQSISWRAALCLTCVLVVAGLGVTLGLPTFRHLLDVSGLPWAYPLATRIWTSALGSNQ